MTATRALHDLGQSLWLDNITRNMLTAGTLSRYISELSITGLTSNPTIFDHAIKNSTAYDETIRKKLAKGKSGEELFFEVALEDLVVAADLFRQIYDETAEVDGWVSLEVSPLLANDTATTLSEAKDLHARAGCETSRFAASAWHAPQIARVGEDNLRPTQGRIAQQQVTVLGGREPVGLVEMKHANRVILRVPNSCRSGAVEQRSEVTVRYPSGHKDLAVGVCGELCH